VRAGAGAFCGADADVDAGGVRGFREGHPQEPVAAQRWAAYAGAAIAGGVRHLVAYLWALARDSKGVLYAGGGNGAKLYRIPPDGKGKLLADLDALEIHAIAVDSKDRVYAATSPDGKVYRIAGSGKPEVFYDPKSKVHLGAGVRCRGEPVRGHGDPGEIHRVAPDGKGAVFFQER